jgi:hypothetical protein
MDFVFIVDVDVCIVVLTTVTVHQINMNARQTGNEFFVIRIAANRERSALAAMGCRIFYGAK